MLAGQSPRIAIIAVNKENLIKKLASQRSKSINSQDIKLDYNISLKMLSFKIAGLLLLAFMTMSLNLQANHQEAYSFVKVFKMDSSYSLPKLAWNEWADFPSLAGSFYLYQDQIVTLSYSIQTYSTGGNYICTRLLIDGADDDRFRVISPATRPTQGSFHSNAITVPVKLSKGKHKIKVQFRSDATISGITVTGSDWLASYAQAAWTDY